MNKKTQICALIFCLLAGFAELNAQVKFFIKFADKSLTPYTINNPSQFLTQASIARRTNYGIAVNNSDLPVTPFYVLQIGSVSNVTVLYSLKWFNGVVVSIPAASTVAALSSINAYSFVVNTSVVNKYKLNKLEVINATQETETTGLRAANAASTFNMGGSTWQNKQMQVDCLHEQGYRGQGMVIAVMDAGFLNVNQNPVFDSLRNRNGILGTRDFVSGGTSVYEDAEHGANVLSCMAAIKPGVIMGSAPRANYWLLRTEDSSSEKIIEEYNWIRAAEFADSVGADILTTSLGYDTFDNPTQNHNYNTRDGKTAPMSIASTMAARKGMFVLTAAGNGGPGYISIAGDADSVCTVGAIDSLSIVGSFSSVGPTYDGRIKPDLVARGVAAWVAAANGFCTGGNGTSFSTPILAGGVACCWQKNRTFTSVQLLNLLKMSATNAANPNNSIGWGRPNLCAQVLGVNESSAADKQVSIYPNPFNSSVNITSDNNSTFKTVELVDVLGHVLKQVNVNNTTSNITLSTTELINGIYFIRVTTSTGLIIKKIVKQ